MCKKHKLVRMGFADEPSPAGTHMCLIYNSETEGQMIISNYLQRGLEADEKVAYFTDDMTPDKMKEWLRTKGVELPQKDSRKKF